MKFFSIPYPVFLQKNDIQKEPLSHVAIYHRQIPRISGLVFVDKTILPTGLNSINFHKVAARNFVPPVIDLIFASANRCPYSVSATVINLAPASLIKSSPRELLLLAINVLAAAFKSSHRVL